MKKAFSLLLLILAVCMGTCSSVMADDAKEEDILYYGDYAYTLANGQATIVGCNGQFGGLCIPDFDDEEYGIPDRPGKEDESATFPHFIDGVWRTVVPATLDGHPVVAIGNGAFTESHGGDIVLPEGLTSIGSYAFYMCHHTQAITIPASVTFIADDAFDDYGGATLRVAEGSRAARYAEEHGLPYTYDMDYRVFASGKLLYTVTDGLATICGYDSYGMYKYTFGYADYNDDDGTDLVIPGRLDGHSVIAIRGRPFPYAFNRSDLTSVTIPEGITSIGNYLFAGCESLTDVTIPESCTLIDKGVFDDCPNLTLTVVKGSCAEEYAQENWIPYRYDTE